jgi:ATP-dependent DNA helicase 2 subunit 2
MYIDVERYFRTKAAKSLSASSYVMRPSTANGETSAQSSLTLPGDTDMPDARPTGNDLSAVKNAVTYKVKDETAAWGKKDVLREDLAKGFAYGSTAVHISESDENVTKLETFQSFTIIGFIPWDKVYLARSSCCFH